jgi:PDZ domain-containing protein
MTRIDAPPEVILPAEEVGWSARRRRSWWWLVLVPLATLAFVLYFVKLPYFVIGPGPSQDVEPLIHIDGRQVYPSEGRLLLTTVTVDRTNAYGLLAAWLDPAAAVVSERDVLGPGQTQEQEVQVARSQMDTSKIDAAVVALSAHTRYPQRQGRGVIVERVGSGYPADGRLFAGDVIVAVNGAPVNAPRDVGDAFERSGPGIPLRLAVEGRPGGSVQVTVVPRVIRIADEPPFVGVGVILVPNFPFPLSIESGFIGGPSAGLMWALGLADLLTPGDLTRGRTIAGTGEIDTLGHVLPIGGIEEKVVAAELAGAEIFLAPRENVAAAREVADDIRIVPVSTYDEALAFLLPPRPAALRLDDS